MFVENNTLAPLENNIHIIYHELAVRSFQYGEKTIQFKQTSLHECEWSMRHLLCQDVIFHRIKSVKYSDRQRQTSNHRDQQMKQKKSMIMKIPKGRDEHISNRQDSDLWVKVLNEDTETDFNEYEFIPEEYLRNLGMTDNKEQTFSPKKTGNKDNWQMSQILRETKQTKCINWKGR